jgi:flagellar protein FlaG
MDSFNVDINKNNNLNFSAKVKNEVNNDSSAVGYVQTTQDAKLNVVDVTNTEKSSKEAEVVKKSVTEVDQLAKAAQQLQDFADKSNTSLEFLVDQDSGRNVIKVIDKTSGDLVKQYPTEEVLGIVAKLSESPGAFINFEV